MIKILFHRLLCVPLCLLCVFVVNSSAAEPLPNTKALTEEGDLAAKMVQGIHKYLDREIAASPKNRDAMWKVDKSSPEAFIKSVEPNRERLRKTLGVVDKRLPPRLEYIAGPNEPSLLAETDKFTVHAVRWAVLPGIDAEGLLLEPKNGKMGLAAVAIPDAAHTPEQIAGLVEGVPPAAQFARRLAENGFRVLVPTLIDRGDDLSANPNLKRATNIPHREFVHRMAYEMGRTLMGYEIQKVLAAVDWLEKEIPKNAERRRLGIIGHGEGGRIALYAGALDDRVEITCVNGVFGPREGIAGEPIDRNVWGLLTEFGDAEVAAHFFSPTRPESVGGSPVKWLVAELSETPTWAGPQPAKPGRGGAAPGAITTPNVEASDAEYQRVKKIVGPKGNAVTFAWVKKGDGLLPSVPLEMQLFTNVAPVDDPLFKPLSPLTARGKVPDATARHKRQFDQLVAFTQKLWRDSDATRKEFWKKADPKTIESWEKTTEWYRDYFHTEVIGKLPEPTMALNPRTRPLYDEPKWTGHEVMLDVYPDVFAYGIVLLPKGMKEGEKRPVVVCQHGLEGRPTDTTDPKKKTPYYNSFAAQLADLGYIVYAPQNPYIGKTEFRQIQRKGQPLKLALFSFIVRQHQRTIDWLETLPNVDAKKIALYGLSYGGKTAMRVPAIEKRYCLSICSADFNEWIGKNVSVELPVSYMWTNEYDMYEFDMGNTFNYAEMAFLIAPRPFMVERGHDDGVGTDEMVAYEYAKIRYLYQNRLKIPDRTAIEFFAGGHEIRGKGTFEFLKTHLGYPK